jgi:hypothetical protein
MVSDNGASSVSAARQHRARSQSVDRRPHQPRTRLIVAIILISLLCIVSILMNRMASLSTEQSTIPVGGMNNNNNNNDSGSGALAAIRRAIARARRSSTTGGGIPQRVTEQQKADKHASAGGPAVVDLDNHDIVANDGHPPNGLLAGRRSRHQGQVSSIDLRGGVAEAQQPNGVPRPNTKLPSSISSITAITRNVVPSLIDDTKDIKPVLATTSNDVPVTDRLLSRDNGVRAFASTRGNLGDPSVVLNDRVDDWLKDRWQIARDLTGVSLPLPQWIAIDLGPRLASRAKHGCTITRILLDWETAHAARYRIQTADIQAAVDSNEQPFDNQWHTVLGMPS